MKIGYLIVAVLAVFIFLSPSALISCSKEEPAAVNDTLIVDDTSNVDTTTIPEKVWNLVWSDEFDYEGLPKDSLWGYERGMIRNQEEQYYTTQRSENASVSVGYLTITALKEEYKNAHYTSASLITLNKESWTYGKIEVRAKLPEGKGVWPAIWTLGTNYDQVGWPKCGEIDIMEFVGFQPDTIHGTIHWADPVSGIEKQKGAIFPVEDLASDFHIYSAIWDKDAINLYVDGIQYNYFQVSLAGTGAGNGFRLPQYLIMNLALGGSWGGHINENTHFPKKFIIDYVRVYQ